MAKLGSVVHVVLCVMRLFFTHMVVLRSSRQLYQDSSVEDGKRSLDMSAFLRILFLNGERQDSYVQTA